MSNIEDHNNSISEHVFYDVEKKRKTATPANNQFHHFAHNISENQTRHI